MSQTFCEIKESTRKFPSRVQIKFPCRDETLFYIYNLKSCKVALVIIFGSHTIKTKPQPGRIALDLGALARSLLVALLGNSEWTSVFCVWCSGFIFPAGSLLWACKNVARPPGHCKALFMPRPGHISVS